MATQAATGRLTDLLLDFLGYLEVERGLSRNTLEAYRSDLQQFGEFLSRRGLAPLELSPGQLAEFISELAEGRDGRPACAPATLQRKVACLRSFYRYLRREQLIDHDPARELRAPRLPARLPQGLSRDAVCRRLGQPRGTRPHSAGGRAMPQ